VNAPISSVQRSQSRCTTECGGCRAGSPARCDQDRCNQFLYYCGEGDIAPYPSGSNALRAGYAGRNIDVLNRGGVRQAKSDRRRQADLCGAYSDQGSMAAQLFWAEEERHLAVFRVNRKVDLSQGLYDERHSKCVPQK
jgi:hypothetical protein